MLLALLLSYTSFQLNLTAIPLKCFPLSWMNADLVSWCGKYFWHCIRSFFPTTHAAVLVLISEPTYLIALCYPFSLTVREPAGATIGNLAGTPEYRQHNTFLWLGLGLSGYFFRRLRLKWYTIIFHSLCSWLPYPLVIPVPTLTLTPCCSLCQIVQVHYWALSYLCYCPSIYPLIGFTARHFFSFRSAEYLTTRRCCLIGSTCAFSISLCGYSFLHIFFLPVLV